VGRSIVEFVSPDELPRQAALKQRILEGGMELSEWRLRRKDGTYVPVELSMNALPNGHLRAFVRDITERSATEEALRLSEAKFSGIVSCSADAIISIDDAQRITMFNEGAERIFGYSKAEILGSPLEVLIPERFGLNHRQHVKGFAAGEETARRMGARRAEIIGLRKNGEEFPADAAISKLEVGG
jgi:PAS domain S-box-containing protein